MSELTTAAIVAEGAYELPDEARREILHAFAIVAAQVRAEARAGALDEARAAVHSLHHDDEGRVSKAQARATIDALREDADKTS